MRYCAKYLVVVAFTAIFMYPLYFLVAVATDTLSGSFQLYFWLLFQSKHELLAVFLSDWFDSVWLGLALGLVLILPLITVFKRLSNVMYSFISAAVLNVILFFSMLMLGFPVEITVNIMIVLTALTILSVYIVKGLSKNL